MKIRIVKRWKPSDLGGMFAAWEKRYGSLNSLQQKVLISKCTSPEMMTDLVMWRNLSQGAEFTDVLVISDPDIFETLSPKRVEILEYLMNNEAKSIRHLAAAKSSRRGLQCDKNCLFWFISET